MDEAHRTQGGDLGRKMCEALPNAFLFGLTGTPINRADRNTFWAFRADEGPKGYMNRCSFQESIRDKATLPLALSKGFRAGAGRGSRTPKGRSPADFESAASASSAIPALLASA